MIVWLVSTAAATRPAWFAAHAARLTEYERGRLAGIARPERRRQFLAAHVAMRRLVAAASGRPERAVRIDVLPDGRPVARIDAHDGDGDDGRARLHVSASHSGEHVAVACAAAAIGVDIERWRPRLGPEQVERWCRHEAAFKAGDAGGPTWAAATAGFALAVAGCAAPPALVPHHDLQADALAPAALRPDWRGAPAAGPAR